ncbi:hypothetical protein Tco_0256917 [Tanacetum coccineum]
MWPTRSREPTYDEKDKAQRSSSKGTHYIYGDESGRNPRNHEESHYSESKTQPPGQSENGGHGNKHFLKPSRNCRFFRRLRRNRPPSPGPRPRKDGGVFNRLGEKNKAHLHVLTVATRVPTRREPKCNQGSIITGAHRPEETADIQRVKTAREVTGNPNQRGTGQKPMKMISLSLGRGKLSPANKTHQGSGGNTPYQAKKWRIHRGLYGKIQSRSPGRGRSTEMHEDLLIHAWDNPP